MNKFKNRISGIDIFSGANVLFFLWMCHGVYYDRFIHYRGYAYIWEFFVYALVILAVIAAAWKMLRHSPVPAWMLLMVQIGIVMHFSGGLAVWHETRLYDKVIFNIRYDKYVHFVNAFVCGLVLNHFYFRFLSLARWLKEFQQIIGVLGLGAVVEIVEYLVTLTVVTNGVGGYDNNMLDMIANFTGSVCCVIVIRIMDKISVKQSLPDGRVTDVRAVER
jgi:hypothetical protein